MNIFPDDSRNMLVQLLLLLESNQAKCKASDCVTITTIFVAAH